MIRLLITIAVGFIVSLLGTRFLIGWLTSHKIGQPIQEDGPQGHLTKAGTPTMGGVAIVAGVLVAYVVGDFYNGIYTRTGLIVMAAILGAGVVGLLDDWIKISRERNLGLSKRAKFGGLMAVAILFPILMVNFTNVSTELSFTRIGSTGIDLGPIGWSIWAAFLILATSNAVNLTDGADGLAAGSGILAFSAFLVIGFWAFRYPEIYRVDHALDLAVIAGALMAACTGFLVFNAAPAQIFMGDAGSLALGTALATLSLATNTHLLLPIIGGLYVVETVSVILQVAMFKMTGNRIFRMAPIHHHFELKGWPETWVVIRFWIFSGALTALGLGLFYGDFISTGAVTP